MRILLDENLDCSLERALPGHEVKAVAQLGWSGMKDHELLELAQRAFDVLMTMDGARGRREPARSHLAVVRLQAPTNRLADTTPLMPRVLRLLPTLKPGRVVTVGD